MRDFAGIRWIWVNICLLMRILLLWSFILMSYSPFLSFNYWLVSAFQHWDHSLL